ncbi:SAM-dependent methyltransferase [Actinomadura sp. CNU-125]|uniref:SAM-dependent methyltransferase n=1 Tax=Actinomadura sp. CNU-125 TaxID=1904961 RepID=UPI00291665CA|nr:SAM-dependent methyltransferase [Actinomadura sp. CNU-125]
MPSGSHLVLTHPTNAVRGARMDEAVRQWNDGGGSPELTLRTVAELEPFFAGLDLLDPGLVSTADWRPDLADDPLKVDDHGAVAVKR